MRGAMSGVASTARSPQHPFKVSNLGCRPPCRPLMQGWQLATFMDWVPRVTVRVPQRTGLSVVSKYSVQRVSASHGRQGQQLLSTNGRIPKGVPEIRKTVRTFRSYLRVRSNY